MAESGVAVARRWRLQFIERLNDVAQQVETTGDLKIDSLSDLMAAVTRDDLGTGGLA